MISAPLPDNEQKRLQALIDYCILDTEPEAGFDKIVQLASAICETPISAVSLIDDYRQWFKSSTGLNIKETSRDVAFCAHTILENNICIVPDALNDERFHDNELVVSDPNIRFYAGAPLISREGYSVGSLCVIDRVPRELNKTQILALEILASQVTANLELRLAKRKITDHLVSSSEIRDLFGVALNASPDPICFKDGNGRWLMANDSMLKLLGLDFKDYHDKNDSQLAAQAHKNCQNTLLEFAASDAKAWEVRTQIRNVQTVQQPYGVGRAIDVYRIPLFDNDGARLGMLVSGRDITELSASEQSLKSLTRTLQLLRSCDAALIRATSEQKLLDEICRNLVELGGYQMAWVGYAQNDPDKSVKAVAQAGSGYGYPDTLDIRWADSERGQGPTGNTIRTGVVSINQNFLKNPKLTIWRQEAIKHGFQSSIALPLTINNLVIGAISIYSEKLYAFSQDEVNMLEELAHNMAYGIQTLRVRTEYENTQVALKNESAKYLAFLRSASDGIHIVDLNGNIIEVSDSFCAMLGYQRDEMIGMNVSQWDEKIPRENFSQLILDRFNNNERIQFEARHRRKDGKLIDVEVSTVLVELHGYQVLFSSSRDISSRKEALIALKDSESWFRSIFDNVHTSIAATDSSGRVTHFNKTFMDMMKYDAESLRRMNFADFTHPEDLELEKVYFDEILAGKRDHYHIVKRYLANNDRIVWVDLSASAIRDPDGMVKNFIAVIQDITERKNAENERIQLQRQLLQAQKMESVGHLAGGIAHDFNNMLGAMLGFAELISMAHSEDSPQRDLTLKYVGQIQIAGKRAKELISQLLIFSRLNTNPSLEEAPVTMLQPVIKEVVHLLRSSIPSTTEVTYDIADDNLHSFIQPVQLHQILMNLAINARDSIGEYGRIVVRLDRSTLSGTCNSCHQKFSGDYAELSIIDTGSGIPEHLISKIFDPFFTTKEVGKGTGMGLSVVHGLVHGLAGHINVSSEVGRGSTITILLPVAEAKYLGSGSAAQKMDLLEESLLDLRVMVVDDEHATASMLEEFLDLHGAQVKTYQSSVEALAEFERDPDKVDLVITDETMPRISGLDLSRAMLKVRPELPILLCTGYSEHINAEIAQQNGIARFMYKPLDLAKMLESIKSICFKYP